MYHAYVCAPPPTTSAFVLVIVEISYSWQRLLYAPSFYRKYREVGIGPAGFLVFWGAFKQLVYYF